MPARCGCNVNIQVPNCCVLNYGLNTVYHETGKRKVSQKKERGTVRKVEREKEKEREREEEIKKRKTWR